MGTWFLVIRKGGLLVGKENSEINFGFVVIYILKNKKKIIKSIILIIKIK